MAVPVVFGITLITFGIIAFAPGDPIDVIIAMAAEEGETIAEQDLERMRAKLGLDKPLPVRYLLWLKEVARGNLGNRTTDNRPVADVILERLPRTVELMALSIVVSTVLAILLGVIAALRQYSVLDYVLTFLTFCGIATPNFFLALGMILVVGVKLGWLPTHGVRTAGMPPSLIDHVSHLIMPAFILGLGHMASLMRQARSSMLEVIRQDYILVARAKGLRERSINLQHAFRNAALPLVTLVGLSLPALFGGSVIVESIFAWPGIGQLGISSVGTRHFQTLMGLNLITACLVLLSNLITDISYAWVDPRIRYQ